MSDVPGAPSRSPIRLEWPFAAADALKVLLAISIVLFSVSLAMNVAEVLDWENPSELIRRLLNTDNEQSVANWFSAGILLICALLALSARAHADSSAAWAWLAILFLAMSADEVLALHEVVGARVQDAFDTGGLLRYGFVIPGVGVLVVAVILFAPLIRSLPTPARTAFLLGAALYMTGALGMEAVAGLAYDEGGRDTLPYVIVSNVEELLEMLGASIVVYALAARQAIGTGSRAAM